MINESSIKVKICGLKKRKDVKSCIDMGVDIVGVVVDYPIYVPWNLSREEAKPLIEMVKYPHKSCIVTGGAPEKIIELATSLKPSIVQLHYKETLKDTIIISDALSKIGIDVIKTVPPEPVGMIFQFGTTDIEKIVKSLCDTKVCGLLADSRIPSNAAENGSKLDIGFLRQIIKYSSKPVITAGGINPENVCDFIEKTKTSFIDVMTGIEKSPGEKDIRMLSELLLAVKKFQP